MRQESLIIISLILASTLVHPTTVGGSAQGQTQSPRDTSARAAEAGASASIEGRIVAASTGQPLKRARVVATARDFRGRLSTQTDETGRYVLTDLRAGAYTLTVSKPGFITVSYGQRRSRQPATPVQVRAGQELRDISLALPAGSVITGHVADEDGAPLPLATVRLLRYVYQQGQRQLVPGGADRTDVRATGVPDGWMLEAVYLNGQDVIDTPLDFDGTRRVEGVRLVLTDQVTQLSGVVHDGQGTELTDFTVIAFPIDERRWGPWSRYVKAARPDQNARYQIRGLPAGEYLLAAVDVVEQGEWHDPRFLQRLRPGALRVSLAAGELTELNITLTSQAP